MINAFIQRLVAGENLSLDEATTVLDEVMRGRCDDDQIARLLLALREKGETIDEVAGAARAMRNHMTPIRSQRTGLVDTCGTGGDGSGTFNISTAAAIVAAAAGTPVAKHGNRSMSSRSGSADVLAALNVNIDASVKQVERCLDELGLCFCFAPSLHPAMKHVSAVRKRLAVPTIFNLLGPLCNPAGAPFQVLGVGKLALHPLLSAALAKLEPQRATVVCGEDGLDEVTLGGPTRVIEIHNGEQRSFTWRPADFGIEEAGRETMLINGPEQSAAIIQQILANKAGPPRDVVVLNAAAAIWTAGNAATPLAAAKLASEAIATGAAENLLRRLGELSRTS